MRLSATRSFPFILSTLAALAVVLAFGGSPERSGQAVAFAAEIPQAKATGTPRLTELLAVGDPAPGFEAGATVSALAPEPRIADDGSVTFVVAVAGVAGASRPLQAVYRVTGGSPQLVFREGDPAPGTGDHFGGFPELPQTPHISGGRLTFAASLDGSSLDGVWSDHSGAWRLLALEGGRLPGMPDGAGIFGFTFLTRGAIAVLKASYTEGSDVPAENEGLWRHRSGSWERVLINGTQAPGLEPGVVFDTDPLSAYGPFFNFRARGDGRLLVQAWVSGPRIDQNNDEALWLESASGLGVLVREGSPAPIGGRGATFGPTLSSPTFGSDGENAIASINDAGAVVFGAVLRGRDGRLNSLWTTRSGQVGLVATGSLPISGFARGGQAPGFPSGVHFATFDETAINNRNQIAFLGFADELDTPVNLTEAIWWDAAGSLALVAKEGGAVPSVPGAAFTDLQFRGLTGEELSFSGFFEGSGIDATNNAAAFSVRPGLAPEVLLRAGSQVEVVDAAGGVTLSRVRSFELGRGAATTGRRVLRVTLADGTSGFYTLDTAPGSGCTPTEGTETSCSDGVDNDCDGAVDADDLDCSDVCTPTQSPEVSCSDFLDNDCDGAIDGDDTDCRPSCLPARAPCTSDSQCCFGGCKGKPGSRTCR